MIYPYLTMVTTFILLTNGVFFSHPLVSNRYLSDTFTATDFIRSGRENQLIDNGDRGFGGSITQSWQNNKAPG